MIKSSLPFVGRENSNFLKVTSRQLLTISSQSNRPTTAAALCRYFAPLYFLSIQLNCPLTVLESADGHSISSRRRRRRRRSTKEPICPTKWSPLPGEQIAACSNARSATSVNYAIIKETSSTPHTHTLTRTSGLSNSITLETSLTPLQTKPT